MCVEGCGEAPPPRDSSLQPVLGGCAAQHEREKHFLQGLRPSKPPLQVIGPKTSFLGTLQFGDVRGFWAPFPCHLSPVTLSNLCIADRGSRSRGSGAGSCGREGRSRRVRWRRAL